MALVAPEGFDVDGLRAAVRATYESVARDPSGKFHFHRGATYAIHQLGYDAEELAALPREATDRFAGVGNPLALGPLFPGETVLDHACGAGTDLLLAARRVGPEGRAIGVDLTPGMRAAAERAVAAAGLQERVEIRAGAYEDLPVADASVDVVISNGVLNLAPDKRKVFQELWRVLRPGGRLYLADVIVTRELTYEARCQADLWAACIAGALTEQELHELAHEVGFRQTEVVGRFPSFTGADVEGKVSDDLLPIGVSFRGWKAAG